MQQQMGLLLNPVKKVAMGPQNLQGFGPVFPLCWCLAPLLAPLHSTLTGVEVTTAGMTSQSQRGEPLSSFLIPTESEQS